MTVGVGPTNQTEWYVGRVIATTSSSTSYYQTLTTKPSRVSSHSNHGHQPTKPPQLSPPHSVQHHHYSIHSHPISASAHFSPSPSHSTSPLTPIPVPNLLLHAEAYPLPNRLQASVPPISAPYDHPSTMQTSSHSSDSTRQNSHSPLRAQPTLPKARQIRDATRTLCYLLSVQPDMIRMSVPCTKPNLGSKGNF